MADTTTTKDRHDLTVLPVRLPVELREQVRQQAAAEDRTQTKIVERALRLYLEGSSTAS